MTQLVAIAKVVLPILICAALGIFARKKEILSEEHNAGIQRFVLKFCVPCVLFNSCLDAAVTSETLLSMALLIPLLVVCFVVSLRLRKKALPYHSLPLLLTAHETGMLGIPLFIILFGVENAFHMGVLDIAQAFVAVPIITLVSADMGKGSVKEMLRGIFTSPILIMGVLGFVLGLSGAMAWLDSLGIAIEKPFEASALEPDENGFLASQLVFAIREELGRKAEIHLKSANKGTIEIEFFSKYDLQTILEALAGN